MSTSVKISELPVLASADAADEFVVVDDSAGVTKKITQAGLADFGSNVLTAGGITFGSTTLDDYEEGTWTPAVGTQGGTNYRTPLYTTGEHATYQKIGNRVYFTAYVRFSVSGLPTFTNVCINGLPFSAVGFSAVTFPYQSNFFDDSDMTAGDWYGGYVRNTASNIQLFHYDFGTDAEDNIDSADLTTSASAGLMFFGSYTTS